MLYHSDKPISTSTYNAPVRGIMPLKTASTRRFIFYGRYTVTDVGISAGENIRGWLDRFELYGVKAGKRTVIYRSDLNEHLAAATALQGISAENLDDPFALDIYDADTLIGDFDPTTAEAQNFWLIINLPHDCGMYDSVYAEATFRAGTSEWGAASAMAAYFNTCQELGQVRTSLAVERHPSPSGSNTEHSIPVGDLPIIGGVIVPVNAAILANVDTLTEMSLKGKDGMVEVGVSRLEEYIVLQALWNFFNGNAPADDNLERPNIPPNVLVAAYADRVWKVTLSTAENIVAFVVAKVADHAIHPDSLMGDATRGAIAVKTVNYTVSPKTAGTAARQPIKVRSGFGVGLF